MIQIFAGYNPENKHLYQELYHLTKGLQIIYPDYEHWYHSTFLGGLKNGTRRCLVSESNGNIMGCCLLKDTPAEKKICTLFIAPEYRRQGIGTKLLQTALNELNGTAKLTVSSPLHPMLLPLLNKFGFSFSRVFPNGSLKEFEYTVTPQKIATHRPNFLGTDKQQHSHQH